MTGRTAQLNIKILQQRTGLDPQDPIRTLFKDWGLWLRSPMRNKQVGNHRSGLPPEAVPHRLLRRQKDQIWESYDAKRALRMLTQESDPETGKRILRTSHCRFLACDR